MSAIDEGIVREYFEQNGFLVRQARKYQVQARRKTGDEEVDLIVYNPAYVAQRAQARLFPVRQRAGLRPPGHRGGQGLAHGAGAGAAMPVGVAGSKVMRATSTWFMARRMVVPSPASRPSR